MLDTPEEIIKEYEKQIKRLKDLIKIHEERILELKKQTKLKS